MVLPLNWFGRGQCVRIASVAVVAVVAVVVEADTGVIWS
jgi:hypothetical protein